MTVETFTVYRGPLGLSYRVGKTFLLLERPSELLYYKQVMQGGGLFDSDGDNVKNGVYYSTV